MSFMVNILTGVVPRFSIAGSVQVFSSLSREKYELFPTMEGACTVETWLLTSKLGSGLSVKLELPKKQSNNTTEFLLIIIKRN